MVACDAVDAGAVGWLTKYEIGEVYSKAKRLLTKEVPSYIGGIATRRCLLWGVVMREIRLQLRQWNTDASGKLQHGQRLRL